MNMFEELKAWADKWNVSYSCLEDGTLIRIYFDGQTYYPAEFSYNKNTGDYMWYGGD